MSGSDQPGARWRTSSYSGGRGNNGDCVEVALLADAVAVRDSKDRAGGQHRLSPAAWRAFVGALKTGEFDR